MWGRRHIALSLVVVMATLITLAYASPPDPTYIGGWWDDADYDDVVILATSATSIVDIHVGVLSAPVQVVVVTLPAAGTPHVPLDQVRVRPSRAPPAA
jgi:hypothetical protein